MTNLSKSKLLGHLNTLISHTFSERPEDFDVENGLVIIDGRIYSPAFRLDDGRIISNLPEDPDSSVMFIDGSGTRAREAFIEECYRDAIIAERISRDYVEDATDEFLVDCLRAADFRANEQIIREFLKSIRESQKHWTLYFAIGNLYLQAVDEFKIGDVTFLRMNAALEQMKQEVVGVISKHNYTDGERGEWELHYEDSLRKSYGDYPACAKIVLEAEGQIAEQIALSRLEMTLNVLRCFTPLRYPRSMSARIGLGGEVIRHGRKSIAISERTFKMRETLVGHRQPYILDEVFWNHIITKCQLERISEFFRSDYKPSQIEERIITAAQWIGAAVFEKPAQSILYYCIALETLLNYEKEEGIANRVATRAAFLIGRDAKRITFRETKRLYGLRSEVTHSGSSRFSPRDVTALENITLSCFLEMIRRTRDWKATEEFTEWLENSMLGEPADHN